MNNALKFSLTAVILAFGMVLSSLFLSKLFVRIRHEQAITVKGYAERDVESDVGRFSCSFTARGADLNDAYEKLQQHKNAVLAYLRQSGFRDEDISAGTIGTSKIMKRDEQGKSTNEIEYHDAVQSLVVSSTNVALVKTIATSITELIRDGIDIRAYPPEFYISDLKDTKLQLLAEATKDGYQRAAALAENSGGKVGALILAQQGVFQITSKNSTDISGYGRYDTSSIEKTTKAIVTLEYEIAP